MKTGSKNLITDVLGIKVGNASDRDLRSGTTVLSGTSQLTASYQVMGGAPRGTRTGPGKSRNETIIILEIPFSLYRNCFFYLCGYLDFVITLSCVESALLNLSAVLPLNGCKFIDIR